MRMNSRFLTLAAASAALTLAACSGKEEPVERQPTQVPEPTYVAPPPPEPVDDGASSAIDSAPPVVIDPSAALLEETVIYFEFDSADLDQRTQDILQAHANYLIENPGLRIRLEGHTDERGTREYNLALGERRAQSAERVLLLNGVPASQVSVISYGEENPVALGSTEGDWALNRRVELNYR